jgi:hypothetical protein
LVRLGLRTQAATPASSASAPGAAGRRLGAVLAGSALAALLGLTAWALSGVSVWLVPAYLALMVLILAEPRGERAAPAWQSGEERVGDDPAELGREPGTDDRAGGDHLLPAADSDPVIPTADAAAAATPDPSLAGSGTGKPRRSRARARKVARTAVEPVRDSSPVTWIRVGPGKFVRADLGFPVSAQAPAQEVGDASPTPDPFAATVPTTEEATAEAHPVTDGPAQATPMSEELAAASGDPAADAPGPPGPIPVVVADASPVTDAPEAAAPAEPDPFDAVEATPGAEGPVPASVTGAGDSDLVTEEYGIAPSAFGLTSVDSPAVGNSDHGVPGEPVRSVPDPAASGLDGNLSRREAAAGRLGSSRRTWPARLVCGIANATPRPGPVAASPRGHFRTGSRRRLSIGSRSGVDRRLERSARRTFGQITHAQRGWRPRAPPRRPARMAGSSR